MFLIPVCDDAEALKIGIDFYTSQDGKPYTVWSDEFDVTRPGTDDE